MSIPENLNNILKELPVNTKLVAITKNRSENKIMEAYNTGHRAFGENRVQELVRKYENLPKDIEWHMVGHLQTNKVKYIAPFVSLIHSVDSKKLLAVLNKEALRNNRTIACLLQLRIAKEETKFGMTFKEITDIIGSGDFKDFRNVSVNGLMGMATFSDDKDLVSSEFRYLAKCFEELKSSFFRTSEHFKELSMGMSDDYQLALERGATIVRIGSRVFSMK
jgi:pyridoxal phosphate enzyme (YggS family)